MRKRGFAIYSVLVVAIVLLAVLVPSCAVTMGTIQVQATLCGDPWEGDMQYTLTESGGSPISFDSVPDSFSVPTGTWACAYISGGPSGAYLVDITPSATQTVPRNGTITFTLNFELEQDAGIEFLNWTVDGAPVEGTTKVVPCQIIDVRFKQWVCGCPPGYNVTVNETSWLWIHYDGYEPTPIPARPSVWLHVVNDLCAVNKTTQELGLPAPPPPPVRRSQAASFNGTPVEPGMDFTLLFCQNTPLDVETVWELAKCLNYTKTINWLGITSFDVVKTHLCVLFELIPQSPGTYHFTLTASAEVAFVDDEDVNPGNNIATSPPLSLAVLVS